MQTKPASPPKEVTAAALSQLGGAILTARTAAGLSPTELAAKLKTAQTNIARLERGGSIPSTNTLQRIAKATGHKLVITFITHSMTPSQCSTKGWFTLRAEEWRCAVLFPRCRASS